MHLEDVMKFSSKGRYAIAALIFMAQKAYNEEQITIISISQTLGISKIYLEQVFSLLKRANIVTSLKGSQGGYKLALSPDKISVGDIARAVENSLFEKTEKAIDKDSDPINAAMNSLIWEPLDNSISSTLDNINLKTLIDYTKGLEEKENLMFFI